MTHLTTRPSGASRATRRLATVLPITAVLAVVPAAAQAHSEQFVPGQEYTPGQSFTPAKSGFEPGFTAGHRGESVQLIVHAVIGGIPFEVTNASFEPR